VKHVWANPCELEKGATNELQVGTLGHAVGRTGGSVLDSERGPISTKVKAAKAPRSWPTTRSTATEHSSPGCSGRSAFWLFIWFLGTSAAATGAEGGAGRLTALAYGGGLVAAAIAMLIPVADEVGALNKDHNRRLGSSCSPLLHGFSSQRVHPAGVLLRERDPRLRYAALPKWPRLVQRPDRDRAADRPIGWAAFISPRPSGPDRQRLLYMRTPAGAPVSTPV